MVTPAGPAIQYNVNARFVPDDIPVWLGNNKDTSIIFDKPNAEWTVQTKNAAGVLTDRLRIKANTNTPSPDLVDNPIKWTAGRAVTAADYSIGRDLDATNQLHLNVPTGATFELSVNDVPEFVLSATQLDLLSNNLVGVNSANITGATGNTLVVDTNVLVVDATNDRVGIGTTAPLSKLEVNGTLAIGSNGGALDVGLSRTATRQLRFDSAPTTATGITVIIGAAGTADSTFIVNGNVGIGTTDQFGGGAKVVGLANATTNPASNPAGGIVIYAEGGVFKVRSSGGIIFNSAQGAAVADAAGGATIDAEARTAINALLARVRVHGLIA